MTEENKTRKMVSDEEIRHIVNSAKNPGIRFTVDLYLLDYIKHCLLEENQLSENIGKLNLALAHIGDPEAKMAVEEVIDSLQCVQEECTEYLEDTRIMKDGGYPHDRSERV